MDAIEIIGAFGDERKTVRISQPNGAWPSYHIMIDNYYHGNLTKLDGEWVSHLNGNSYLTTEDICILGEIIDEKKGADK